ncbi:TonB family protein [Thalassobius sp. S69A]|uniref:cell envelope integrity protein TolA n=1 Tax=unclassified Thalassovita TaxID=2619711 RepID=UPI003C7A32C9
MSARAAKTWALAAVLLSGAVHAAVLVGMSGPSFQMPAGGEEAPPEIPLLGNDFADLAAGVASPVSPQAPRAQPADVASPVRPRAAQTSAVSAPLRPATASTAPLSDTPPPTAATPPSPQKLTAAQPPSTRPPKTRPAVAQGNAQRNAVRGNADGQNARKNTKVSGQTPKQPPSAKPRSQQSMASYGASVVRKIRSIRKKRVKGRGKVLVGFEIAPSGGLRSVRVVRSSGSDVLDRAALDHIRRAAPFAPPPKGKARFSFEFVNR